jgi:hypothetical protein
MLGWLISPGEKEALLHNASQRTASKAPGSTRRKGEEFTDLELDAMGVFGEYAAARFCEADYNWEILPGGDGGIDFMAGDFSYAVKFNHRESGYLIVEMRKRDTPKLLVDLKADIVIATTGLCGRTSELCRCRGLMTGPSPVLVGLRGWLFREEFMKLRELREWTEGAKWIVKHEALHDIRTLPALERR